MSRSFYNFLFWSNGSREVSTTEAVTAKKVGTKMKIPNGGRLVLTIKRKAEKIDRWPYSSSSIPLFFQGWELKPPIEWLRCDHTAFKRKAVLQSGQRFHTPFYTWMRDGCDNHPHRTLKFCHFRHAMVSATVQSLLARSTIGMKRVVW